MDRSSFIDVGLELLRPEVSLNLLDSFYKKILE